MKCIICGLDREGTKEHIIPESLGNNGFVLCDVCKECNEKLGANVDSYLTDHTIIKMLRKAQNLNGKDNKEVKLFPSTLLDKEGRKYLFRNDLPSVAPSITQTDNMIQIGADTLETAIEMARRKLDKLGKTENEIEEIISKMNIGEPVKFSPEFSLQADMNFGRYKLAGIKIAYEFAYKSLGEKYYNDEVATHLRKMLYDAAYSKSKELDKAIDYDGINRYSQMTQSTSEELKQMIMDSSKACGIKFRHVCLLHGSMDNEIICEVFLFLDRVSSFTIKVSNNSWQYRKEYSSFVAIIEDGSVLEL